MYAGIEITNDSGRKQIIDTAPILTLERVRNINNTNFRNADAIYISPTRVVALKPSDGYGLTTCFDPYGRGGIDPHTGVNMRHFVVGKGSILEFQEEQPIGNSSFGLEVYDKNGVIQYSSNQKPLRVLDFIDMEDVRSHGDTSGGVRRYWSKSYGGRDIAVITSRKPVWRSGNRSITTGIVKRGNTYSIEALTESLWAAGGVVESWNYQGIVVDATNY